MLNRLLDVKNVVCPYCGYTLPMIYDRNTNVENLLISCKGRQCKKNFVLNIQNGVQQHATIITEDIVEAFKVVFGTEYREHLHDKYGDFIVE